MIDVFSIPKCQRKLENCGEQKFDKICTMCHENVKSFCVIRERTKSTICLHNSLISFVKSRNRKIINTDLLNLYDRNRYSLLKYSLSVIQFFKYYDIEICSPLNRLMFLLLFCKYCDANFFLNEYILWLAYLKC